MSSARQLVVAGGLYLGGCCFSMAFAQGPAVAGSPLTTAALPEMVVTATKTGVDPASVPFTVHSVDATEIQRQPQPYLTNIGELIRDLPGVSVGQVYPLGPPWIQLRGTGYFVGRTIYVVDGLPLLEPIVSTTIHPNDVERIDVVLGPSSALYGPNASGGVVNVITRRGAPGMGATGAIAYGSFDTWRPQASVGGGSGDMDYYLSYSGDISNGYPFNPVSAGIELWDLGQRQYLPSATLTDAAYEKHHVSTSLGWRNAQGASVRLAANYMNADQDAGQPNRTITDDGDQLITSLTAEVPVADTAIVRFRGGYQYFNRPSTNTGGLTLDGARNLVLNSTPTLSGLWGPRTFIPLELQTDLFLGDNNILTGGVFFSHLDDNRSNRSAATGQLLSKSSWKTDNLAFYLQNQTFLLDDRLSLVAGLRHDSWKYYDIFDSGSTNRTPPDVSKHYTTYRGGARFQVNDQLALRGSAGTAFWPGATIWFFQNLSTGMTWREANPNLDPEKTWMVDLGADMQFPTTGAQLGLTAYYGKITDMVSYRYDENPDLPGGSIIRTQNLGGAEIYGLEILGTQPITEHLSFRASLTLNRSRIEDTGTLDGNQLRNAPDYHGSIGFQYLNPTLVNADLRLRFSDSRYYDDENTDLPYFLMDAYETLDLKVWRDWKVAKDLTLTTSLSAINLLDQDYQLELHYVAPGRYLEGQVALHYAF
ncbi:TonB-dependent receptor [Thioalkalicoccus limnaeus]|uniref:TonB-dependent receptor n=1 Tax=Thioalkalicoccus limnaeus TaxID=120681 RepID=A0ABV4BKF3_9GAMM